MNGRSHRRLAPAAPAASARVAGLRYVSEAAGGIARRRRGHAFQYVAPDGSPIRDEETLARIRKLAIPPAWTDVWICPLADGHLQATGRDARGRKQYRYHARWREVRDGTKYARMIAFARVLPSIRRQVRRDLGRAGLPREKALATVVRLLETTFIRIGNEEYARENESFGLTTLRERQVRVKGSRLRFRFRGKSGVEHHVQLTDRQLARIVARMQDLPGENLFHYLDADGASHSVESADVNEYLRSVSGDDFTSKDFRTWAGTVLCARELRKLPPPSSDAAGRRDIAQAVEVVARQLGNTRAVCRKCYIHPAVLAAYEHGRIAQAMGGRSDEAGVLALLGSEGRRARRRGARSGAHGRSLVPLLRRSLAMRVAHHPSP